MGAAILAQAPVMVPELAQVLAMELVTQTWMVFVMM
jgi:hypothetical protein